MRGGGRPDRRRQRARPSRPRSPSDPLQGGSNLVSRQGRHLLVRDRHGDVIGYGQVLTGSCDVDADATSTIATSTDWPAANPRASRSSFGMTTRPPESMVDRLGQRYRRRCPPGGSLRLSRQHLQPRERVGEPVLVDHGGGVLPERVVRPAARQGPGPRGRCPPGHPQRVGVAELRAVPGAL